MISGTPDSRLDFDAVQEVTGLVLLQDMTGDEPGVRAEFGRQDGLIHVVSPMHMGMIFTISHPANPEQDRCPYVSLPYKESTGLDGGPGEKDDRSTRTMREQITTEQKMKLRNKAIKGG